MVLPDQQRPGICGAGLDRLRSEHPTCPVAVTTVLGTDADSVRDTAAYSVNELPSMTGILKDPEAAEAGR
jgi:hypothetical protein